MNAEHVILDGKRFTVGPDEITVYNPGQVQASWAETQEDSPWECFSIHISPETAAAVTGGDPVEAHRAAVAGPGLAGALRRAAIAKVCPGGRADYPMGRRRSSGTQQTGHR
ncbi:AraC family ligand binding domain-containing protein [Nesterenkonia alkaliphila]|uniref:AraC family ligand binding domain-containing protein n=1 Tax=Nesterenkonia alkaliphila TaxID=1463631 RepID=UPI0012FB2C0E|nr:AraC family ligand binding domain-containing protein [Nesterenkonia alkaliphila]